MNLLNNQSKKIDLYSFKEHKTSQIPLELYERKIKQLGNNILKIFQKSDKVIKDDQRESKKVTFVNVNGLRFLELQCLDGLSDQEKSSLLEEQFSQNGIIKTQQNELELKYCEDSQKSYLNFHFQSIINSNIDLNPRSTFLLRIFGDTTHPRSIIKKTNPCIMRQQASKNLYENLNANTPEKFNLLPNESTKFFHQEAQQKNLVKSINWRKLKHIMTMNRNNSLRQRNSQANKQCLMNIVFNTFEVFHIFY